MVIKPPVYTFVWNDEFVLLDKKEKPSTVDLVLYIDEESKYMRLTYPSSTKNIIRTKLQSKLMFIQKRGLWIESLNQRVGEGNEFHVDSESPTIANSQAGVSESSLSASASTEETEQKKPNPPCTKTI